MALLPKNKQYTDKDFDSIRSRLIDLVQTVFPQWTNFDTASFDNMLLEMYAFLGDLILYYLDTQARESRLQTATQRKNVIALARMFGYRMHGAHAATAVVEFRVAKPPKATLVIPAGTIVRTKEITKPIKFRLMSNVTIPAGANPPVATGIVEHSEMHNQVFAASGLAYQDIVLDHTPYLDDSAIVVASNGIYTQRDSLLNSGSNDLHYTVLVDQNDRATIRFGNGTSGAIPQGGIGVTYKTGGGVSGNVEAERIVVVESNFHDVEGNIVHLSVRNPEPASDGTERQSLESAKLLIPESLRANTRTVTREDFEVNARRVPGVARALMLTANEDKTIPENSGILYVVPAGGGLPTPALKNLVRREVTEMRPCSLTFQVSVQNPLYKEINIEARVFLEAGYRVRPVVVRERIKANLAVMFQILNDEGTTNEYVNFGYYSNSEIPLSDIYNVIRDTDGVRKLGDKHGDLKINGLPADVNIKINEIPVLGPSVLLYNGDTGRVM